MKSSTKLLSVIAKGGVPVVLSSWLDKCIADNKWLDDMRTFCIDTDEWWKSQFPQEQQDELPDIKIRGLSDDPSPPIFKGLDFYRDKSFAMPQAELKGLIECAGGKLLTKMPPQAGGNLMLKLL